MDAFADNWPVMLVVLAVVLIFMGLVRKLVKLAFFGVALGALGLFLWPMVSG